MFTNLCTNIFESHLSSYKHTHVTIRLCYHTLQYKALMFNSGQFKDTVGRFLEKLLIDGWLRMGLLPPLGNFADISYLVEN